MLSTAGNGSQYGNRSSVAAMMVSLGLNLLKYLECQVELLGLSAFSLSARVAEIGSSKIRLRNKDRFCRTKCALRFVSLNLSLQL